MYCVVETSLKESESPMMNELEIEKAYQTEMAERMKRRIKRYGLVPFLCWEIGKIIGLIALPFAAYWLIH